MGNIGPERASPMGKNFRAINVKKRLDQKIQLLGTSDGMVPSDAWSMDAKVPGFHRTLGPLTTKFKRLNVGNV